jgi:alkylhydroperoxidase/carboxymuconolactone decarboxylase family protein YurZ
VSTVPEAFVALPGEAEMRSKMPVGSRPSYDFGFLPRMGRLMAAHPRLGAAMRAYFGELMFAPGALSRAEREMVAAVTAAAQSCDY